MCVCTLQFEQDKNNPDTFKAENYVNITSAKEFPLNHLSEKDLNICSFLFLSKKKERFLSLMPQIAASARLFFPTLFLSTPHNALTAYAGRNSGWRKKTPTKRFFLRLQISEAEENFCRQAARHRPSLSLFPVSLHKCNSNDPEAKKE